MAESSTPKLDMKPWNLAVTRAVAFAEERGARIVGVTGNQPGVGVSLLSRALAEAYARHGRNTILVDASRIDMASVGQSSGQNARFDLLDHARKSDTGVFVVDLSEHAHLLPADTVTMKEVFESAAGDNVAIVVDLPAVSTGNAEDAQSLSLTGAACSLVYLVCLSGVITKAALSECVESCKINRIPLDGLIINDWKQPGARLAVGW